MLSCYLVVEQVKKLRSSSVELEILTDENSQNSNSSSIWLVPLLLLPGNHVQNDAPKILKRLQNQGIKVNLLPFLGSCPLWLSTLQYFVEFESRFSKQALVHHPLSGDIGSDYFDCLTRNLNIPIISWADWNKASNEFRNEYSAIPYSLAPNKNTKKLRKIDSISSLLEIDLFLLALIEILFLLP